MNDRILFTQKILFAPSILNSRLEFEIPFDLVALNYTFWGQDRLKFKFSNLSVRKCSYIKQLYTKLGLLLGY